MTGADLYDRAREYGGGVQAENKSPLPDALLTVPHLAYFVGEVRRRGV
jgi:hypothetical protein